MILRKMTAADADGVLSVYQEGIDTGHATFQDRAPDWDSWDKGHLDHTRVVVEIDGRIVGFIALSAISSRPVYRGVAEESIYVSPSVAGQGVGSALMKALIETSEKNGVWTLQSGIFPENEGSLALHQKHGFRILGTREKVGLMSYGPMKGVWRDVLFVERRSNVVGV